MTQRADELRTHSYELSATRRFVRWLGGPVILGLALVTLATIVADVWFVAVRTSESPETFSDLAAGDGQIPIGVRSVFDVGTALQSDWECVDDDSGHLRGPTLTCWRNGVQHDTAAAIEFRPVSSLDQVAKWTITSRVALDGTVAGSVELLDELTGERFCGLQYGHVVAFGLGANPDLDVVRDSFNGPFAETGHCP